VTPIAERCEEERARIIQKVINPFIVRRADQTVKYGKIGKTAELRERDAAPKEP
jgi:hypothetical protein